jgi:acyl-CoA thioester hydrolase
MTEVVAEKHVGEARVRVRYAETDQMGVVYHSNYLIWFEVGRVELIRSMGLDYKRMEVEEGCGISVVDVHAQDTTMS